MKLISVVSGCYNEEENVEEVYRQVKAVFEDLDGYDFELVFIDNASRDNTVAVLRRIAKQDKRVKVIINTVSYTHLRAHET